MKVKPNFFIVGAAKSGTTSLYRYLNQHPDIYFSPIKEPNYFSDDIDVSEFSSTYKQNTFLDVDKYFKQKGLPELPISFIRKIDYYNRLFEKAEGFKIIGEASTSYLYSKTAAQNIFDYNPEAKIMAILRNPMERAFSHYQMAVRYGHTKLNLKSAVEKDQKQRKKGWGISELFIELGLYHDQLKRYFETFPQEQIKVIFFDDLRHDPQKLINECCEFLEIDRINLSDTKAHNIQESPENIKLNYFLTQTGMKSILRKILPGSTKEKLGQSFYKESRINLGKEDFNFLLGFYKDEIENTANLLKANLDRWLEFEDK